MNRQYPLLDNLMYAYFNQDYEIISGPELDDVIDDFFSNTSNGIKREVIKEINTFICNSKDIEKEFYFIYSDADVFPEIWSLTALEFLEHVSKKAQDFLNEHTEQDE
ncbi:contact-dependent growth inhibition system immunity protein [Photorhabdus sp. P32]|uniref:contact-dependent growth inhibition system immunity protein n=1 Tax=Photorhabdus TaxID=29487 RepID=UPI002240B61F|nr:contact-dependent growth inhibition system immunity protein [Photorhabdus luminescens]MCW7763177.1 contact-dependent growth inhibition system immunity protein [Photorhabdus luminescens subsp. venezuelensis]